VILGRALLSVLALVAVLNFESELKSGPVFTITAHGNVAVKVLANNLAQSEPQSYTMGVEPATALENMKWLPYFLLILSHYPRAFILDNH